MSTVPELTPVLPCLSPLQVLPRCRYLDEPNLADCHASEPAAPQHASQIMLVVTRAFSCGSDGEVPFQADSGETIMKMK
jgi:hypothetical protein